MPNNRSFSWYLPAGYLVLAALLFFYRNLYLAPVGLLDFDSVTNFGVAKALAAGDFTNLFKHASPTFNLFLALLVKVTPDFIWLEKLNGLLILGGVYLCSRFAGRHLSLKWWQELFLFAVAGSSLTLTYQGRSLSLEALSFLGFCAFFLAYFQSLMAFRRKGFFGTVLLYGVLLTVNYKLLVLLPIILLIEMYQQNRKITGRQWLAAAGLVVLVFVLYSVLGFLLGLSLWRYLFVAGAVVLKSTIHPTINVPLFNFDVGFYFRYLFSFENPFLLIGLLLFPFTIGLKQMLQHRKMNAGLYVAVFGLCLLFGMSLLQKAPRGIMPAYPLLYLLSCLGFLHFIKNKALQACVFLAMLGFNLYTIQQNIFWYADSGNPEMAKYLAQNRITKIATTASNRILSFVPETTEVKMVFRNEELKALKAQGYNYLLIDDSYKIGRIPLGIKYKKVVAAYPDKVLQAPVFALEHAEYSGMTYDEALEISNTLRKAENQLFLVAL